MWFLLNFAIYEAGDPEAWLEAYSVFITNMHTKHFDNEEKTYAIHGHEGRFIRDICENLGIKVLTYEEF
jgi:hypothetical protein